MRLLVGAAAVVLVSSILSCGECNWAGPCQSMQGRNETKTGLICNYPMQITSNIGGTIRTANWTENYDRDPQPWNACECTVTSNTLTDCRVSVSNDCESLTTCDACLRNRWCGWCDGKCALDTPVSKSCQRRC